MGLGPIRHTEYYNAVNLEIIDNTTVLVFGNESAGKYLEFVDINTDKIAGASGLREVGSKAQLSLSFLSLLCVAVAFAR